MQHLLRSTERRVIGAPARLGRLALLAIAIGAALWGLDRAGVFQGARLDVRWTPNAQAAVGAVPQEEIARRWPILSLVMAEGDLYDPARGLLANVLEHGPDWERPGIVAYFDEGRLRFATTAGVRVHGGGSRITSERQGFRLYFRRRHGARQVPPGVLFEAEAQPIRRLVVHNDARDGGDTWRWHLVNPLAYDIAEAMGGVAPDTRPVRFFLNGELQGLFVLTERIDEEFFAAHAGHRQVSASQAEFDELWRWVVARRPLLMADVASRVDLDNLTRWFLSVAFCATRDAYQGPGQFRDLTRAEASWFWVNWDMDLSFRVWDSDSYAFLLEPVGGPRRGRNPAEPRATILTRLLLDDPAYREFFARTFDRVMNHRVTTAMLRERFEHYREVATTMGGDDLAFLDQLKRFLDRRPAFFRTLTEQWLNIGPSQPLHVSTSGDGAVSIDGEVVRGRFEGLYLPERDIRFAARQARERFVEWRVNGVSSGREPELRLALDGPTEVEAVYGDETPAPFQAAPAPPQSQEPEWRATPLTWVGMPAGRFRAGCIPGDPDCGDEERVQYEAVIEKPFSMLATEVTVGQFAAFAARSGQRLPRQPTWVAGSTHPVVNVTWDEATAFCEARQARLPTEHEWEFAARGGVSGWLFPWEGGFDGQANLEDVKAADQFPTTSPVGSFPFSRFGLADIVGNVWEWTADKHDPLAPDDAFDLRVVRGGSWMTGPRGARISARAGLSRSGRHNREVGFRCVR